MDRETAVDRAASVVETVATETMPVPVREVWVYGDVALGLDPVERLDVYVTKDVLFGGGRSGAGAAATAGGDASATAGDDGAADATDFEAEYGVKGIDSTVRAEWAAAHPEWIRASDNGYAAPEKCLAAHLLDGVTEPVHLEVCNTGFGDNVTQRLRGALAREAYDEVLDPRGVCLWAEGQRDPEAFEKLREGSFAMPTLEAALEGMGADPEAAAAAAEAVTAERAESEGTSVRGDVV
ncbi:hypothetical protein GCM10027435_00360 [Haloparvum alkalitolerans]|uniref:DUF7095 family protein n=1 Tax=Haloparvum alkalitolerans TaxID=1042953 RepID=UPI003CF28FE4